MLSNIESLTSVLDSQEILNRMSNSSVEEIKETLDSITEAYIESFT